MEENNKHIDNFIKKNLEIEKISSDFSTKVMEEIFVSDLNKERALTTLMQKYIMEEIAIDFTSTVLSALNQNPKSLVYQPVITRKTWIFIGSLVGFIFLFTIFKMDDGPTQISLIDGLITKFSDLLSFNFPTISISPLFTLSIFALSSLLYLDYFIRNRQLS